MHHTLIHASSEGLLYSQTLPSIADSQKYLKCQKHSPPSLAKKGRIKKAKTKTLTPSKIHFYKFRQSQAMRQVSETAATMHRHTALDQHTVLGPSLPDCHGYLKYPSCLVFFHWLYSMIFKVFSNLNSSVILSKTAVSRKKFIQPRQLEVLPVPNSKSFLSTSLLSLYLQHLRTWLGEQESAPVIMYLTAFLNQDSDAFKRKIKTGVVFVCIFLTEPGKMFSQ